MARINVRPSYVSTAASSRLASASATPTPGPAGDSDQENHNPVGRRMDKGKQRASDPPRRPSLPTPSSEDSDGARGQKRKRDSPHDDEDEDDEDEGHDALRKEFTEHFDPNQDPEVRRTIKRKSRALEREFQEQRDDLMRDRGDGLTRTVNAANAIYKTVKQTNDATMDSRLLVNVSDLANKKTAQLVLGDSSTGIDVDEFLSKCITFMRNGGPDEGAPSTARRRRQRHHGDDEDEDDAIGEILDWEVLGRYACFPSNSRPCVPNFLLGPLSVEKKTRVQTQRRARQSKDTAGREARPEALTRADLSQSDENGLTAICTRIRKHLCTHIDKAIDTIREAGFDNEEALNTQRGKTMLRKCKVSASGGVPLFEYVVNPQSFGQTVENLFYVSFLIKEASCGIGHDSNGLPILIPTPVRRNPDQNKKKQQEETEEEEKKRKKNAGLKHQAVLSLDYSTWQSLIEAFNIRESMIPHRHEESEEQVGQRGWYT